MEEFSNPPGMVLLLVSSLDSEEVEVSEHHDEDDERELDDGDTEELLQPSCMIDKCFRCWVSRKDTSLLEYSHFVLNFLLPICRLFLRLTG